MPPYELNVLRVPPKSRRAASPDASAARRMAAMQHRKIARRHEGMPPYGGAGIPSQHRGHNTENHPLCYAQYQSIFSDKYINRK